MKKHLLFILIVLIGISLLSCAKGVETIPEAEGSRTAYDEPVATPTPSPTPEPPKRVFITAVGDIMFHSPQIKEAFNGSTYDFKISFEDIKHVLESADIAIGNFETTININKKPTGYPRFNAPVETLDAIRDAGFDVLVTANNHSADTGAEGIESTAELIKSYGMIPVGTGKKEAVKYGLIEKNDVKIGILAYTSSTNGLPAPEGMINITDLDLIQKDIDDLRPQCDFLIVYVHTGTEYVRQIEDDQLELFRKIADLGADCVLGSHPHVARQSELYITNGREVFINYSLGNFLSNQNDKYTDVGGLVQLSIVKHEGKTVLEGYEMLPVYRLRYKDGNKTIRKVILCSDITKYESISESNKKYIEAVSEEIMELADIGTLD